MLTPSETKVLNKILPEKVIELAKKMVQIDTQNPPGKEKDFAVFIEPMLKSMGLETSVFEFKKGRPDVVAVYRIGESKKAIIFDGHMDTVPFGDLSTWSVDPLSGTVKEGKLFGRGSADMKGSIAAYVYALKTLINSGIKLNGNITLILTSDEEASTMETKYVLEKGYHATFGIVGEPSNLQVHTAHKGFARWKLTTYGKSAHSSTPDNGVNAIYKMAKAVTKLEEMAENASRQKAHPLLGPPTFSVGIIKGGTRDNVVPDTCEVTIERRLLPGEKPDIVEKQINDTLSLITSKDPQFKYNLSLYHWLSGAETPPTAPVVSLAKNAVQDIVGQEVKIEGFAATTEMVHLTNVGIPSIILGCGHVKQTHIANEYVLTQQIIDVAKAYALIMLRYLGKE